MKRFYALQDLRLIISEIIEHFRVFFSLHSAPIQLTCNSFDLNTNQISPGIKAKLALMPSQQNAF